MTLKKEFAFGIDEKLFTSEQDRERYKSKFMSFIKKIDMEIKFTDKYIEDRKNKKGSNRKLS